MHRVPLKNEEIQSFVTRAEDMERESNKYLTAAVCLGAAAISVTLLLKSRLKQRSVHSSSVADKKDANRVTSLRGELQPDHSFYQIQANSHVVQIHTLREWHDVSLGVKFQFSPQHLRLTLEERQYPVIHVKFAIPHEQQTVSVVIEECNDVATLDDYRDSCLIKLENCAKVLPSEQFTMNVQFRTISYQYTNEKEEVVTVFAVLQKNTSRCVTVQLLTIGERSGATARSVVWEIVRSVSFSPPSPSSSFLFCTEPRHGVGLKLPLNLTLVNDGFVDDFHDGCIPQASSPFATLLSEQGNFSAVARYERFAPAKHSTRDVLLKLLHQAKSRYSLRKQLTLSDACHPKSVDELPVTIMSCKAHGNGDEEGVQRANDCAFFVAECAVDSSSGHSQIEGLIPAAGGASALLCVYLYNVLSEFVSLSFFMLKGSTSSFENFLPVCTGIADSLTVGNHYGQETTLLYCNRRFCYPFDIRLGSHWKVWEPPLGDPLCIVSVLSLHWQEVEIRGIPCPYDVMSAPEKFQRDCWHRVLQLPSKVSIRSSVLRPPRKTPVDLYALTLSFRSVTWSTTRRIWMSSQQLRGEVILRSLQTRLRVATAHHRRGMQRLPVPMRQTHCGLLCFFAATTVLRFCSTPRRAHISWKSRGA